MFVPLEKPKDKGEIQRCMDPTRCLVDRSDEVVVGTIRRVVEASIVHRMLEEQRGDARDTKSVRGARGSRVQPKQLRVGHALVL